jgi:hypothetical protein
MKPVIERSSERQMNFRESQNGVIAANRFLVNGLIRAGRTADA